MAIPQGRDAASFALACQSITGGSDDFDRIGTNKQVGTFRDGDGALGVLAQGEAGNAESGGFFLDAAGIREDELGFAQETEKIEVADWRDVSSMSGAIFGRLGRAHSDDIQDFQVLSHERSFQASGVSIASGKLPFDAAYPPFASKKR
jgi:hypothetical protein